MKKVITGIFAGALSVAVLAWAFDAAGKIDHNEGGGHHEAATVGAEHAAEYEFEPIDEFAESGSAGEFADALDYDLPDDDAARTGRSRGADLSRGNDLSRRALNNIELTDEQQEQISTLRSAYARDMVQLRADSRLARIDLNELMGETSPDLEKVKELAAAVSRAQGSVFERGAVFRAEVKNVLTPEQQEELRESFRGRSDGRRDSGMRWRRGGRESHNRR